MIGAHTNEPLDWMPDAASPDQKGRRQLDRELIARTALDLIDRHGPRAMSMRRIAAELQVDTMMLYRVVPNREAMTRDVVGLLLDEMDVSDRPGESWDQAMMRVSLSELAMALRHPQAFPLVALAPRDAEPVLSHIRTVKDLLVGCGLPEERFVDVWLVDAAFSNGFLLLAAEACARGGRSRAAADGAETSELAAEMAGTLSAEAFERGLTLIYTGLKDTFLREAG